MDLKFASLDSVTLSLRVKYISDGYDADDSYYLTGMDDRKSSFWVGGAMTWKTDFLDLSAEILGDTSDYSNGYRSKFQAEKGLHMEILDLLQNLQLNGLMAILLITIMVLKKQRKK